MTQSSIKGVVVTPLKIITDDRGDIKHMLRSDSPVFKSFGEIYFSFIHPGIVKAWHLHMEMTLNYAVPVGNIKFVLYDAREESATKGAVDELFIGEKNYCLVTVPPGIWSGFKGLGANVSVVANFTDIPYREDEIVRDNPFSKGIPYNWGAADREIKISTR